MEDIDFLDDAENAPVSDNSLEKISALGQKMADIQAEIEAMEEALKQRKEELLKVQTVELPEAMDAIGMKDFSLKNGKKVIVKDFVHANISKANEDRAFAWLRDNGHGDLIKNVVSTKLGRGQEEIATKIANYIKSLDVPVEQKSNVPWNTLTAWAKEQINHGEPIPVDLLGVYIGRKAEVK